VKRRSTRNGHGQSEIAELADYFSADNVRSRDAERAAAVPAISQWQSYSDGSYGLRLPGDRSYEIDPVSYVARKGGGIAGYSLRANRGPFQDFVGAGGRAAARVSKADLFSSPEHAVLAARSHYRDNP
jgi:hypothetical protein